MIFECAGHFLTDIFRYIGLRQNQWRLSQLERGVERIATGGCHGVGPGVPMMDGCNFFFSFFSFLLQERKPVESLQGKKTLNVYVVMNLTLRGKIRDQQSEMQSIISTYKDSESKIAQLII